MSNSGAGLTSKNNTFFGGKTCVTNSDFRVTNCYKLGTNYLKGFELKILNSGCQADGPIE